MTGKLPAELVDRARQADVLLTARNLDARLRRINAAEHAGPCVVCGGDDRFSVNTKKQAWHCRGCGKGGRDAISLVMHMRGLDFREAVEHLVGKEVEPKRHPPPEPSAAAHPKAAGDDEARNLRTAARIVADLVAIKGTPGEQYLREVRKIDTDAVADVLERVDAIAWHPSVLFREEGHRLDGRRLGCIVAIMTDIETAEPTGAISRTWLTPDLAKVGKAKTLGTPAGIIRLSEDADVLSGLHIAEGLETALDGMMRGFRPMWAMSSTALMARFPVLDGVEALTIIADRDQNGAGEIAAGAAAERWRAAGREVTIKQRRGGFGDINDATREAQ
jgi:putative DNA primase/helicase